MVFGLLFGGFAVLAFHADDEIPLQWKGVLALFFVWGVWMFVAGLFNIDHDSAPSYFAGSVITACFAVVVWLLVWRQKTDWSGGIPFIPAAWNQIATRLVFALAGLLLAITAAAFFRKAMRKRRKDDDDVA